MDDKEMAGGSLSIGSAGSVGNVGFGSVRIACFTPDRRGAYHAGGSHHSGSASSRQHGGKGRLHESVSGGHWEPCSSL